MPLDQSYDRELLSYIRDTRNLYRVNPLVLGGTSGSSGGSGAPPGGIVGQLSQRYVSADTAESFVHTSGSPVSLFDNLNNLRSYAGASHRFFATETTTPSLSLYIADGVWYYASGSAPLVYAGGTTPVATLPVTNPYIGLLTIDTLGHFAWTYGAESVTPTEPLPPSATSGSMPLWSVYFRTSGSGITAYDQGAHYIYADRRPYLEWGVGGAGGSSGSNPSSLVGTSPINGVATTFMRSDAAPAIDQSMSPTWSGNHTFTNPVTVTTTGVPPLSGGTITYSGGYTIHTFNSSGTLTVLGSVSVDALVVGGGGGGNGGVDNVNWGAGGAGGLVVYQSGLTLSPGLITVTVGQGGAGTLQAPSGNGTNSSLGTYITATSGSGVDNASRTGGSNALYTGGTDNTFPNAGGGAGAGGNGSGINGGVGVSNSITGVSVGYGGGGGGNGGGTATDGGGAGVVGQGVSGTANRGGGGGGGDKNLGGGNGGSGVVIVRYLTGTLTPSTYPFIVNATATSPNLGADLLDGYHASNSSGSIPINNGTLNTNLNADLLDGLHATSFAPVVVSTVVSTNTSLSSVNKSQLIVITNGSTVTLPTATGNDGLTYNFVRSGTANAVVNTTGGQKISGDTSLTLTNQWDSVVVTALNISGVDQWIRIS